MIESIRDAIARNDLTEALKLLRTLLDNSPQLDEILVQSGRFHAIRKQIRLGLVSPAEASIAHAQILAGLTDLLREIEEQSQKPAIRQEIAQVIHYHYYHDRKIPRNLTAPPFYPEVFIGRETEMDTLHRKLFSGTNLLLLVNGQGGVGKTSLASRYYHRYQSDYAHTAWLLSESRIAFALLRLAQPLGLTFDDRMPLDQRLDQLLAAMAELNRPCLLVIDNANEVEDLKENYLRLHRCKNFHLLLTTRITTFEQAETYRIEGLPPAQALELFQKYYPKHTPSEDALFEQIRTATGGNTLVIELLSKNLALLNKLKTRYTLTDLLSDLQNKGVLALSQSRAVSTGYQSKEVLREESPEALIAAMYELGDLSREEVAALSVLSVLPPEEIPFDRLEVLCPQSPNLDETLLSLSQKGWIEYNETATTFKISPVVQQITRKKNENLYEDCEGMIRVLLEKLEYEGGIKHLVNSTYEEAAIWVRYAGAVVEGFEAPYRSTSVLCERMGAYFTATGDLIQALAWFEKYEEICTRLCERDPDNADFKNLLAISYSKLGSTYTALGQLDRALAFYEQFTSLIQELYEAYPNHVSFKNGLAISYAKLGETHTALGQLDRALAFYEQYHRLEKELHEAYPNHVSFKNGLAISYQFLGITHTALGQLDRALVFYEQYHRLEKELHETHPDNVNFKKLLAISYQFLGNTHTALGQLDRALAFFEDETQLFEQLYEAYPNHVSFKNGLAISYEKLGSTHTALGQLDRALAFYEERARLGKELYEAYPNHVSFKNGLAISYIKLGDVARRQGDKTAAIDYFRQAEGLYLELVRDAPGYADFQNNLTWVRKTLKELE